jgi:hypothetical protein
MVPGTRAELSCRSTFRSTGVRTRPSAGTLHTINRVPLYTLQSTARIRQHLISVRIIKLICWTVFRIITHSISFVLHFPRFRLRCFLTSRAKRKTVFLCTLCAISCILLKHTHDQIMFDYTTNSSSTKKKNNNMNSNQQLDVNSANNKQGSAI